MARAIVETRRFGHGTWRLDELTAEFCVRRERKNERGEGERRARDTIDAYAFVRVAFGHASMVLGTWV